MKCEKDEFQYVAGRFADIQMLRYRLNGFSSLTLQQKKLIYCLSEAALWGRDITFDQFGAWNIKIRKTLEAVYLHFSGNRDSDDFRSFETYLKRVWFSSGIHHHYNQDKFVPGFSEAFFREAVMSVPAESLPLEGGRSAEALCDELVPVIFSAGIMRKRVCLDQGADKVMSAACLDCRGVSPNEAVDYYRKLNSSAGDSEENPSFGLNTTLVKENGVLKELTWKAGGMYSKQIEHIVYWLRKAAGFCENKRQQEVVALLVEYYLTGDLAVFDRYSMAWTNEKEAQVDFVNGFIEVYGDPLGIKGSWEAIVHYKDMEATKRTAKICENARWFEDNSPVDKRFRKKKVCGVTANVVCAAMLGGDEYPASGLCINLPNADCIR